MFKKIPLLLLILSLAGCSGLPAGTTDTPGPPTAVAETSTAPATQPPATATDLPPAPLAVALIPENADPALADLVQAESARLAAELGYRWQVRQSLTVEETAAEVDFLVGLPQAANLPELIQGAPETQFLVVGYTGLQDAPNLINIGAEPAPQDLKAFMGGFIAAVITPEWRVGLITVQDGLENLRFPAFANGVRFFCGLCRQQFPPFYEYPFLLSLPATASDQEWRALADFMRDRLVETVYVSPGAGGQVVYAQLADLGVRIIGGEAPPAGLADYWVASLRSDPAGAYLDHIPDLFNGESGISAPLPVRLTDVNPSLLTPGRLRLAEATLDDVLAGFIQTGDPMQSE